MSDLKNKMDQFEFQSSIFTVLLRKIFNVCKNWSENHKTHAESKIILGNESSAIIENNY